MKKLITIYLFFITNYVNSQTSNLLFHSGFEPNTYVGLQTNSSAGILGIDNSVSVPNDWQNHLWNNLDTFNIQYNGGSITQRLAEISTDPLNSINNVLHFWIRYPNDSSSTSPKGRVQGNFFNIDSALSNVFYSIKLLVPSDFTLLMGDSIPPFDWLNICEFHNNILVDDTTYAFRIGVQIAKQTMLQDSLTFKVEAKKYNPSNQTVSSVVWEKWNTSFNIPIDKWMTLNVGFVEGDSLNGRFYFDVTPDGGQKTTIFNETNWTHHPNDPNPDGLTDFNPFKLYTDGEKVDSIRSWGGLLQLYWDDFSIWKDSLLTTGISTSTFNTDYSIYPNPTDNMAVIKFDNYNNENYNLTLYDTQGRLVREIDNITSGKIVISTENLVNGVYLFRLLSDKKRQITGKLIVK